MSVSGREAYKDELTQLAFHNEKIICIEADLGGKKHPFQQSYPDRFLNMGIAEMAGIDMAAGMAQAGFIPFFSTFAAFAALRSAESLKLAMGYMGKNVKVVAAYGGVAGGWFGTTHHCLEDVAILRTFQNVRIACPHGEAETRRVIREAAASDEPYYIRLARNDSFDSLYRGESGSCRELLVERAGAADQALCLISVGEQATELSKKACADDASLAHAHICYADSGSLNSYIPQLKAIASKFLVVEEHRGTGSTASHLALLMPECEVYSHDCGEKWPIYGGSHAEVLDYLGFGFQQLKKQIRELGGTDGL